MMMIANNPRHCEPVELNFDKTDKRGGHGVQIAHCKVLIWLTHSSVRRTSCGCRVLMLTRHYTSRRRNLLLGLQNDNYVEMHGCGFFLRWAIEIN